MGSEHTVGIRYSIQYLQDEYAKGNKKPLEDVVRAWKGIQELPATDKNSFFMIGGFHGEPFQYRPAVDALSSVDTYTYWGGYCNHGNVLFPTWHRMFVWRLEKALQSIVPGVMMPYWDETSADSLANGIPSILTEETFELDGETIPNPLRSFSLPKALDDFLPGDNKYWSKPQGYQTVRYPLSGLVGTPEVKAISDKHNANYLDPVKNTAMLNDNVKAWLAGDWSSLHDSKPPIAGIAKLFELCLDAPNYTVFSNTTSAQEWNRDHPGRVVPLEEPHNDIHLSVGGFDAPNQQSAPEEQAGANGDMGENNTASMDPIFFFHHCNIDRVFWLWQKRHGYTEHLEIIPNYAGTSSSDLQGPTPGIAPGTSLDLDSPLNPFVKDDGTAYTSKDCINIEQLGYNYAAGSLEELPILKAKAPAMPGKKLAVRGINRSLLQGSFVLSAYALVTDEHGKSTEHYLGHYSVLSRWNVVQCANCLTHLEVAAYFPLGHLPADVVEKAEYRYSIQHRGSELRRVSGLEKGQNRLQQESSALPDRLQVIMEVCD